MNDAQIIRTLHGSEYWTNHHLIHSNSGRIEALYDRIAWLSFAAPEHFT